MRPLDRIRSIKVKFGVVILLAVAMTLLVNEVGLALDVQPVSRWALAALLSLAMVQVVAHGMTSPLREMAAAARAMARGDWSRRVHVTARDEVGALARAFTSMATDLAVTLDGGVLAEPIAMPRDLYAGEPLVVAARFATLPQALAA